MKPLAKKPLSIYSLIVLAFICITQNGFGQASILWSNTTSSTWQTTTNWTGSTVPSSTDIAQMGANPTGAGGIGVDMGITTNNGSNNQAVGAFEMTSARVTSNPVIGNNSTVSNGTLTFFGATVNSVPNVIIRNNSAKDITLQNTQGAGTMAMNIALANTTDNKIIQDAGGKIVISSAITGASGCPLTVQGIGTSEVDITNATNSFSGLISLKASETVFPADGCFGAIPGSVITNAIVIDGGRMTANATYTLNSNRGIKVGTTAGTSISVKTGTTILTYNGVISDLTTNGSWAKQGGNVFQLGGVNIYSGATGINNGTIRLINGNDRLPVTTTLNIGQAASANVGIFDLYGFNQQIAGLNSTAGTNASTAKNTVTTSTTPATLTLSGPGNYTYGNGTAANSGIISGAITIIKNGSGLQIFGDQDTYTGTTLINAGELRFSPVANENLNASSVILNGGLLGTSGITAGKTLNFSTLSLTGNSSINLESVNSHSLYFASSNAASWIVAKTLTITGWQGTYAAASAGTVGRIFIGSSASDLTSTQLSQITFFDGANYYAATLLPTGELVPYCTVPIINSVSGATVLCAGMTLNLSASASGTLAPAYSWAGPNSFISSVQNPTITGAPALASGVYTITATNACGTSSASTSVTVNPLPLVVANTTSNVICTGQQITLSGSGANTYTWSNSVTDGLALTPTASAVYSVTGKDNNNCSNTETVSITVNITPTLSVNAATICAGDPTTLTASGATSYTWNTSSNTSSILVNPTTSTNYTVSGSNPGCISSLTTAVTVYSLPLISVNSATICVGATTTLSASGADSYTWSTGSNSASISQSPTTTVTYTISGSSSQGCINSSTTQILVNPLPVINSFSTSVCTGGTATLSVSGANTYTWDTGSNSTSIVITPTANMNYTITGTSIEGCINSGTTALFVTTSPSITVNSQTICTGNSATLIATGVSTYTWNNGPTIATILVSPTSNTIYTVSGNASGCGALIVTNTVALTVNSLPTVAATSTTICSGNSATLISSGANSYTWTGGSNAATITPTPSTTITYTVTGTSLTGCMNTATSQVLVNPTPTLSVNSPTICSGDIATLTAGGSTSYTWSTNANTISISVTPTTATTYTVYSSVLGCIGSKTTVVTVNALPVISVSSSSVCSGETASLSASGAQTYTWSTTSNASSITPTPSVTTNYTVSGSSLQGCINFASTSITVISLPTISVNSATICTGTSATLSASGAATYTWNTSVNGTSISVSPLSTTNYSVAGTLNGCTGSNTSTVTVNPLPTITVNSPTICSSAFVSLVAAGGVTYTWNAGPAAPTLSVNPITNTVYVVTGSSSLGCTNSATAAVTVLSLPAITFSLNNLMCQNDAQVSLSALPAGGTFTGTGVSGTSFNPSVAGTGTFFVTYTFSDSNNCSASVSKPVTVDACTGIEKLSQNISVTAWPNPAQNELNISIGNVPGNCKIEIFDLSGNKVSSTIAQEETTIIDVKNYKAGLYIVRITSADNCSVLKIIKE